MFARLIEISTRVIILPLIHILTGPVCTNSNTCISFSLKQNIIYNKIAKRRTYFQNMLRKEKTYFQNDPLEVAFSKGSCYFKFFELKAIEFLFQLLLKFLLQWEEDMMAIFFLFLFFD